MTVVVAKGFAWVAAKDGVAHAHPERGRFIRTICNLPPLDPRYAYPATVRCPDCQRIADGDPRA